MLQIDFKARGKAEHIKEVENRIFKALKDEDVLVSFSYTINEELQMVNILPTFMSKDYIIGKELEQLIIKYETELNEDFIDLEIMKFV